ncbi:hypothetical protein LTR85_003895 [Meristemomyces frigidus]|nr:hypothetical protein LTR85_003895 [Meristemomyces frigidus]
MPVDVPNFLTPTGNPGEERIDIWKRWLAGETRMDDPEGNQTDLLMVLKAASDHIVMDLDIHADSLLRQAQSAEYGSMIIEGGDKALRKGRTLDWTNMPMEAMVESKRESLIDAIQTAKEEIDWLRKQIRRLESLMEKAKENQAKGLDVPLRFLPDKKE